MTNNQEICVSERHKRFVEDEVRAGRQSYRHVDMLAHFAARFEAFLRPAPPTVGSINAGNIVYQGEEYVPLEAYAEAMAGWTAANALRSAAGSEGVDGAELQALYSAFHNFVPSEGDGRCLGVLAKLNGNDRIALARELHNALTPLAPATERPEPVEGVERAIFNCLVARGVEQDEADQHAQAIAATLTTPNAETGAGGYVCAGCGLSDEGVSCNNCGHPVDPARPSTSDPVAGEAATSRMTMAQYRKWRATKAEREER